MRKQLELDVFFSMLNMFPTIPIKHRRTYIKAHAVTQKCMPQAVFYVKCSPQMSKYSYPPIHVTGCQSQWVSEWEEGNQVKAQRDLFLSVSFHGLLCSHPHPMPDSASVPFYRNSTHCLAHRSSPTLQKSMTPGFKDGQATRQQVGLSVPEEPGRRGGLVGERSSLVPPTQCPLPERTPTRA